MSSIADNVKELEEEHTVLILCDLMKAFSCVFLALLLKKLEYYGI